MKNVVLCILSLLAASNLSLRATEPKVEDLLLSLANNRISANYKCSVKGDVPLLFQGSVIAQETCFVLKGDGLEIYCDGDAVYVCDVQAKEVCVENISSLEKFIKENAGSVDDISVTEVEYSPLSSDKSVFIHPVFDKSWVITDLR